MPEVSYEGFGSRLVKSIGGAFLGVLLFFGAFPVLLWNEYDSVQWAKSLEEGAAACVSVSADKVDPANNGKLIHVSGDAASDETLKDDVFGISAKAIKLERKVEIYQWFQTSKSEKKKNVGGGETTTTHYIHDRKWVDQPINSSDFKPDDAGNIPVNVGTKPYANEDKRAKEVKLGAFKLSNNQVKEMGHGEPLPVTTENLAALPEEIRSKLKINSGNFYQPYKQPVSPDTDAQPEIGDVRVTFLVLKTPQTVSLVSGQEGDTFKPWHSTVGKDIDEFTLGTKSKDEMFAAAQQRNIVLTWILRLVGFLLMAFGIFLVAKPFIIWFDILPFFGDLVSMGVGIVAVIIALPLTLMTIAASWILVRPLVAVPLLVGGLAILGFGIYFIWSRRSKAKAVTVVK